MLVRITYIFIFIVFTKSAFAYLGPGMGGGILTATIGVLVAMLALCFGIIYFPLKKLYLKIKSNKKKKKN